MIQFKRNRNRYGWMVAIFFLLVLISACQSRIDGPKKTILPLDMKTILIFSFQDMSKRYGENVGMECPLCKARFIIGTVEKEAVEVLTSALMSYLENQTSFHLTPASPEQEALLARFSGADGRGEMEILLDLGRKFGVDGVVMGHIYRYRERVGSRYSVESPASVAFCVDLVNVRDGAVVWVGSFNETQQSLFENLFRFDRFIKRKGRWVTAREMAASGLEGALMSLGKE